MKCNVTEVSAKAYNIISWISSLPITIANDTTKRILPSLSMIHRWHVILVVIKAVFLLEYAGVFESVWLTRY